MSYVIVWVTDVRQLERKSSSESSEVFVSRWCYKFCPLKVTDHFSRDGIGVRTRVKLLLGKAAPSYLKSGCNDVFQVQVIRVQGLIFRSISLYQVPGQLV